ncbi:MAG TPA: alpha/beta hydrolase [Acidobacteriaceae bacterium]|nr:alpha/beta hydrolase [Acidobacteriaceae bacterium]
MRQSFRLSLYAAALLLPFPAIAQSNAAHPTTQFVTVDPGVQLQVVDWGGSGTPLIFLGGAGDSAHRFDSFAPQFTKQHHVYGITRKGTPPSSSPEPANGNYTADHLADDVLAVMKALQIERPVLVGHSIAGEELSSIGSRFPQKVSALIYLDAATGFALYDPAHPLLAVEMNDIKRRIDEIEAGGVDEQKKLLELEAAVSRFEKILHQNNLEIANMPPLPPRSPIAAAINFGMQKYTSIPVPVLAIYACPHNWDRLPNDPSGRKAALIKDDKMRCTEWIDNFRRGVPAAQIVVIPNADHYVYLSNPTQVASDINAFLANLHGGGADLPNITPPTLSLPAPPESNRNHRSPRTQ